MIFPSAMRPVLERRAIREASSSVFLRKRSRNDIEVAMVAGLLRKLNGQLPPWATFDNFHDHAVAADPVVFSSEDLVFARKVQHVGGKRQTTGRCVVSSGRERGFANG